MYNTTVKRKYQIDLSYECNIFPDINKWSNAHKPKDSMIYKDYFYDQICFIKDKISYLFHEIINPDSLIFDIDKVTERFVVISTHISKSIELPVVLLDLEDLLGLQFIIRNNFHDWKVSVLSDMEINLNFGDLFLTDFNINPIYCEGFHDCIVFNSYKENNKMFTLELDNNYKLYTFLFMVTNHIRNKLKK
ncbi:MAG: hypothetical protein ACOCRK_10365 [bacterium]